MFGITNEVKTEEKKHSNGIGYGGYGSRLAYEQFCREQHMGKKAKLARSAIVVFVCLMFGMIGMFSGILIYDLVDSNKTLYYPLGSMPKSAAENEAAPRDSFGIAGVMTDFNTPFAAETVTQELSRKYRIPVGVMLHRVELESSAGKSGMRTGDIVVELNGEEVANTDDLSQLLVESSDSALVTVYRNNQYLQFIWKFE